jgi:hypothetical protein
MSLVAVPDLIRRDCDRLQLRAALLEGARSSVRWLADVANFESLRPGACAPASSLGSPGPIPPVHPFDGRL